jgi:hypothetical protein
MTAMTSVIGRKLFIPTAALIVLTATAINAAELPLPKVFLSDRFAKVGLCAALGVNWKCSPRWRPSSAKIHVHRSDAPGQRAEDAVTFGRWTTPMGLYFRLIQNRTI